jgi:redox-sensitive bicupin YhaK (pirin superfamily)
MPLVETRLAGRPAPVGDFTVRRVIPQRDRRFVGPFCFLDHMGPHTSMGTADGGVAPHPHIGLATVTYLFDGEVLHRDSLGTEQRISPGDVNWMTAGNGIVHSERTPTSLLGRSYTLHGLQFWVALPLGREEGPPSFQHAARASLPFIEEAGVSLRVVLGQWRSLRSPVELASPLTLAVAELDAGAELELDTLHPERAVYVVDGDVRLGSEGFTGGELAALGAGEPGAVTAVTNARVAFMAGPPLDGPRHLLWNFVASSREKLVQAREDWIAGVRFKDVPGDPGPRIPFPEALLHTR